ncbi:hypothetical protein [Nocardioides sp. Soil796]|uniref:hypothetical protein n=1 Tax=Nocardioides sp. Soil796 TaxID=1736412 RepID=UPI00070D0474|nr:hypothetical protein [Nocardioides sp. Soil796]KRF19659.1 hypothetical protein ASH02_24195 [Nocardioides sp. Soil796]
MNKPDLTIVKAYLGNSEWDDTTITAALNAEAAAQAKACRVPSEPTEWPADLAEALCRRVAANLANRNTPLGFQSSLLETGGVIARTGGGDREVRRFEAPYKKLVIG